MPNMNNTELLKDKAVRDEIDRYKWIESEKAGHDIGFERASQEWLSKFSSVWIDHLHGKKGGLVAKIKKSFRDL